MRYGQWFPGMEDELPLDRYGQQVNTNIQLWLSRRRDEAIERGDSIFAEVADVLRDEAASALEAGHQPWQPEWEVLRNAQPVEDPPPPADPSPTDPPPPPGP